MSVTLPAGGLIQNPVVVQPQRPVGSGAAPNDFFSTCLWFCGAQTAARPRLLIALRLLSAQHRQAITPPPPLLPVCRSVGTAAPYFITFGSARTVL